ncbi:hypothetical protein OROMI_022296 [Orobanche minor]
MAFLVAKQFSLTLVLISLFLSSSRARDSQYFSKVSRAAEYSNQQVEKTEEQTDIGNYPSFYQQEDGDKPHGLYAAPSPPTIPAQGSPPPPPPPPKHTHPKTTSSSWRPKNYNTESYVTPLAEEDSSVDEETHSYTTTRNNGYDAVGEKYRNTQLQGNEEYSNDEENSIEPRHTTTKNRNNDDRSGAMFVNQQGMSDTRYYKNGKFHYDIKNHVYSHNHPYEVLKATNNRNAQLSSSNNHKFLPNAFTGYKSYENSANNYNSMDLNDQNEEDQLFEQEDDSDMP